MVVSSKYMIYWALAVWGQARYLSLTEALHNTESLRVSGEETFVYNPLNADIFCINYGDQRIFSIWNHHKCFSYIFLVHLNTYVMGLWSLEIFLLLQCEGPKYVVFTYKQFMTGYYDRIIAVFKWPLQSRSRRGHVARDTDRENENEVDQQRYLIVCYCYRVEGRREKAEQQWLLTFK